MQQSNLRPQIDKNITRKPSFLKAVPAKNKNHDLSDQKKTKKNIFVIEKQLQNNKKHNSKINQMVKKSSVKYSKTQKNQTPTKMQGSIKTIKVTEEKWQDVLKNGLKNHQQSSRPYHNNKKKSSFDQIINDHQNTPKKQCKKVYSNANLNRIRFKAGNHHKRQQSQPRKSLKMYEGANIEHSNQCQKVIKSARQKKSLTQQKPKQKQTKPTIDRVTNKSEHFDQFLKQEGHVNKMKVHSHFKTNQGNFNPQKLQKAQIGYLTMVAQCLRKTIRFPTNLDFPEVFIVTEKGKHQKVINQVIIEKHQKSFKTHIIYCRLAFYLVAHYILLSLAPKPLVPVLNHLHDSQTIILGMFGVHDKGNKKYSNPKMNLNEDNRKNNNQIPLAIQNRGHLIHKNNLLVKNILSGLLHKSNMPFCQLFQSLFISSDNLDSFEFIAFLDKTLKWQVLKMPSFPFLPPSLPQHNRHLILDLDQTLIHFDVDRQQYHIRPHAQKFIKKMRSFYQITIFTAGTKQYADQIINQIDKQGHVKHRLYRNHLTFLEGQSVKDLSMLGRPLKSTLIIDNLQSNFRMHPDNGIPIKSWFNDSGDRVLQKLQTLLIKLANDFDDDLRKGVRHHRSFINKEIGEKVNQVKIRYGI